MATDDHLLATRGDIYKLEKGIVTEIRRIEMKLSTQIEGIDNRLDAIELEDLPRRVHRLEVHTGIKA